MISIKKSGMKFAIILTLILLSNFNLFADYVYTVNEGRIKGTVIEELDDTIKFITMDNEEIYIYKDKIRGIIYCKNNYIRESYNEFGYTLFDPAWFNLSYSRWFDFFGIKLVGMYYYDYAIDLELNFKLNDYYHFMHGFGISIGYMDLLNIEGFGNFKGWKLYTHYFMNVKHIFIQIGIGLLYGDRIFDFGIINGKAIFWYNLAFGFNFRFLKNTKRVNYKKKRDKKKQFKSENIHGRKKIWKKRIK